MSNDNSPVLVGVTKIRPSGGSADGREMTIPRVLFNPPYNMDLGADIDVLYDPDTGDIILRRRTDV